MELSENKKKQLQYFTTYLVTWYMHAHLYSQMYADQPLSCLLQLVFPALKGINFYRMTTGLFTYYNL